MFCPNLVKNQNVCPHPIIFSLTTALRTKGTFSSWTDIKKTFKVSTLTEDQKN